MSETWTLRPAEFVLPGHPDKLADSIADTIVQEAWLRDPKSLVGVEVAVHRDVVFIDGRVAGDGATSIDFRRIARSIYAAAGYGRTFGPDPARLKVRTDLCLGRLLEGEAEFRRIADDQSIIVGHWCGHPGLEGLPIEHALARRLAVGLHHLRWTSIGTPFGPDGKVFLLVEESPDGRESRVVDISVSLQHKPEWDAVECRRAIESELRRRLELFAKDVPGFDPRHPFALSINAAGDFIEGGPLGDNGLSGKKLVVDCYGPRIPIGGGAMSGKDFQKADRAGPLIARELARLAVERLGCRECTVTLGIRPGDTTFRLVRVEADRGGEVDVKNLAGLGNLALDSRADWPRGRNLVVTACWGHFAASEACLPREFAAHQGSAAATSRCKRARIGELSAELDFQSMCNCFSARVWGSLWAEGEPVEGLDLEIHLASDANLFVDSGQRAFRQLGQGLRCLSQVRAAIPFDNEYGLCFCAAEAIEQAKRAFPWLIDDETPFSEQEEARLRREAAKSRLAHARSGGKPVRKSAAAKASASRRGGRRAGKTSGRRETGR